MKKSNILWRFPIITVVVLLIDQATKYFAAQKGWMVLNTGISFGLGEQLGNTQLANAFLGVFLLCFSGVIGWWMYKEQGFSLGVQLFLGGAFSNIIDRIILGGVQDWLPIPFVGLSNNIADYCVVVGLVLFFITAWSTQDEKDTELK